MEVEDEVGEALVGGINKRRPELVGIDNGVRWSAPSRSRRKKGKGARQELGGVRAHGWRLGEDKASLPKQGDAQQVAARWPDCAVAGMGVVRRNRGDASKKVQMKFVSNFDRGKPNISYWNINFVRNKSY